MSILQMKKGGTTGSNNTSIRGKVTLWRNKGKIITFLGKLPK